MDHCIMHLDIFYSNLNFEIELKQVEGYSALIIQNNMNNYFNPLEMKGGFLWKVG